MRCSWLPGSQPPLEQSSLGPSVTAKWASSLLLRLFLRATSGSTLWSVKCPWDGSRDKVFCASREVLDFFGRDCGYKAPRLSLPVLGFLFRALGWHPLCAAGCRFGWLCTFPLKMYLLDFCAEGLHTHGIQLWQCHRGGASSTTGKGSAFSTSH